MEPEVKRAKLDIFDFPIGKDAHTPEEVAESYAGAVKAHPFYDNVHSVIDLYESGTIKDGRGNVVGVVLRRALPEHAAAQAASLLTSAAVRTSLRSAMFGGEAPLSGIAGYFDYRGSPVELKARKTAFTSEHEERWPLVFPAVDYVSEIYRCVMPQFWKAQNAAIPDIVRIHGTPFSTLTINSRFRTASHTDAGDFDGGYSCISCIDGDFKGLCLTFDDFRVNVLLQPRDVLVFDSHHFHSNTEIEVLYQGEDWRRLTCVFYYRSPLGEPASYAEYKRRLEKAKREGGRAPVVQSIEEKDNGTNLNKPSPVFPITPSPFCVAAVAHCLYHCAARAACVHNAIVAAGSGLAERLFGEPLTTPDGMPLRCSEEKLRANGDSVARAAPRLGGFSESDTMVSTAEDKKRYLELEFLSHCISAGLLEMWTQARTRWLELVEKEWKNLLALNSARQDFLWKNRSDMNAAFFDLCEVAKQVMLGLLDKESAKPREEQAFWTMFAVHLCAACEEELHMPHNAMSLRKLNVKLKDFNFGGTRYFKDMPEEEQQRRLDRKKHIEEARRSTASSGPGEGRGNWLTNDAFDYQTEDCAVEYRKHGWAVPAHHAAEVTKNVHLDAPPACTELVRVLVVLPDPPCTKTGEAECKAEALPEETEALPEWARLMSSPAVHRVLATASRNLTLPDAFTNGNVEVAYAFQSALPSSTYDFVVLQHVLSRLHDDGLAATFIGRAASLCSGCVFVTETDVQCRQYFTLHFPLRREYDAVAPLFFRRLHKACYGTEAARTRTKAELEALLPTVCCARYKLQGSPLNTVVYVVTVAPAA